MIAREISRSHGHGPAQRVFRHVVERGVVERVEPGVEAAGIGQRVVGAGPGFRST
jgi:hypothetical protein